MHHGATTEEYRPPVSRFAVVSIVATALMPFGYFNVAWVLLSLIAIPARLAAVRAHRKYGHAGSRPAMGAIAVAMFFTVAAPVWHYHLFHSEAPAGYARLDFARLSARGDDAFAPFVGRKICLKGFQVHMGKSLSDATFRLSSDGNYKRREYAFPVEYKGVLADEWHDRVAVSGVLERNPDYDGEKDQSRYRIIEAEVRPVRSGWQLPVRMSGDC